ncbi:hypothetical protein F4861DRAFT_541556 [Xylaria intraflava]|nr:hypothetical protein F4861DRAFT_541556 [Xylaria intraflava]
MSDGDRPALPSVERVSQQTFLAITWTAVWVAFSMLVFRLATRIKSFKKLLLDDYLVILAWLLLLVSAILWQLKSRALYLMYAIQSGRSLPTPEFPIIYGQFLRLVVAWNILFYSCLWSVKFSFLVFFRRLGNNVSLGRIWWWVVFGFTVAGLIASVGDIDYRCTVNDLTFITEKCGLVRYVEYDTNTFYGNMAIDIATDLLIISIPFRILWNVRIPLKKKILLLGVFSVTIIIIITSVIRVVLVKGVNEEVQIASIDWLYLWSNIEAAIAITVACLASFRTLFIFKQTQQKDGKTTKDSLLRFAHRFYFKKLSTDTYKNGHSGEYWMERQLDADSQHRIVPLQAVHVNRSIDVTTDEATPEVQNQVHAQNRGYDFE